MASESGCSEISVSTPLSQRLNDDSDSLSEDLTEVEINGEWYARLNLLARKKQRTSWVFRYGSEVISKKTSKVWWWCQICRRSDVDKLMTVSTSHIKNHLKSQHEINEDEPDLRHTLAAGKSSENVITALTTQAEVDHFKSALIYWLTCQHIPYSEIEAETFRNFVAACSVTAESLLPRAKATVRGWIIAEFESQGNRIRDNLLAKSKSQVHLSFDLWTAPNNKAFMDVVSHFVGPDNEVKTVLLAAKQIHGNHSGENQSKTVLKVIERFNLSNLLGYFVDDNATTNDSCVREIIQYFYPQLSKSQLAIKTKERRLRCAGHVINLVAKAFLFGENADAFEFEASKAQKLQDPKAEMNLWRKKGPIGKLHNLVRYIRASPQREETFQDVVSYEEELTGDIYLKVIENNRTRWNSTYLMIRRALRLQSRLITFVLNSELTGDFPCEDVLSSNDWAELCIILDLLEPLHKLTLRMQGYAIEGKKGTLWEFLLAMEIILSHFEKAKDMYRNSKSYKFLATAVNNAWAVADKYYKIIDDSTAYVAAVVLNPSYKWSSLEKLWAKRRPWLKSYEKRLKKLWIEQYQNKSPDNSRPASQDIDDIFQQHLCLDPMQDRRLQEDGYETYCTSRAGQTPGGLIHWWISQEDPDLAQWALNMHSIPAMSAECERVFSSTKLLITPRRNRLLGDFVEANECLCAWKKAGLI